MTAGFSLARATPSWWRLLSVPGLVLAAVLVVYVLAVPLRVAFPGRADPPVAAPGDLAGVGEWLAGPRDTPLLVDAKVARDRPSWWLEEAFRGH